MKSQLSIEQRAAIHILQRAWWHLASDVSASSLAAKFANEDARILIQKKLNEIAREAEAA